MNTLTKAAITVALAGGCLFGAYHHGVTVTTDRFKSDIATAKSDAAEAVANAQADYRALEQQSAADMAAIAQTHLQDIANREAISNRTIDDLRTGTVSLRARFTSCQPAGSAATAGTSTGQRDAAAGIELRQQDAGFLVRLADEADKVADQLRACQAVVNKDRATK